MTLPSELPPDLQGVEPVGPAPGSEQIALRLYFAGSDPRGESARLRQVSDPRSSSYARYLSTAAFARTYGPSSQQIATLESWVAAQGMKVTGRTLHFLAVRATVKEADAAFTVRIDEFGTPSQRAPIGDPSLPASVGPVVATVLGLSAQDSSSGATFGPRRPGAPLPAAPPPAERRTSDAARASASTAPCSSWWDQHQAALPAGAALRRAPTAVCGYTPSQLRAAYGVAAGDGRGRTVAVILDGNLSSMGADADRFFADHGVAGFAKDQFRVHLDPRLQASCRGVVGGGADLPEEPLDVETVHALAPAADVVFAGAGCSGSEQSFLDAETEVVDGHLADVTTDSFATTQMIWAPAMTTAWTLLMEQGGLEGIGFDFDAGDSAGFGVQFPSADPYATSVGGTSLEIGRTGSTVGELGWGDDVAKENAAGTAFLQKPPGAYSEGTTGGPSIGFAEPWYQRGVVSEPAGQPAVRQQPDVSADASPETGMLIGYTPPGGRFAQSVSGGTSAASPLVAGLEVDAADRAGHALGFVNPALYALRRTTAIRDILPVSAARSEVAVSGVDVCGSARCLITMGRDDGLRVVRGWDPVTGIGAVTDDFIRDFPAAGRG